MSINASTERPIQPWKLWVCAGVCAYLALSVATETVKPYHWLLLLLIPGSVLAAERGRRFLLDWAPLFTSWVVYDRMRWVQPFLLDRVQVEGPLALERAIFGWTAGGAIPAHALKPWMDASAATPWGEALSLLLQVVYLSHVVVYPTLFAVWWFRGRTRERDRRRFVRHAWAFTALNALGFVGYLAVPVAPPWWVTLHGAATPTPALVASAPLAEAIHGAIVQHTIATAPNWFAAFPSLHGAYPVLLLALNWREGRGRWLALAGVYGALMWTSTVVLNLHYIVDLVAGALLAGAIGLWFALRQP